MAKVGSIGKSFENRDIWVVDIGFNYNPKIIIDCGIHAREQVSPALCFYLINELTEGDLKKKFEKNNNL